MLNKVFLFENQSFSLLVHFSDAFSGLEMSLELDPGFQWGCQEPNHLSEHHCLPVSALAGSWSQNQASNPGTLIQTMGILTARPNTHTEVTHFLMVFSYRSLELNL